MRKFLALGVLSCLNLFAFEHLTMDKYMQLRENKDKYIIDFYAPWCPPCQVVGEYLKEIDGYKGVKIYKVNIDESKDLASLFNITSIPTLIFVKDKMIVKTINGLVPENSLKQEIEKNF